MRETPGNRNVRLLVVRNGVGQAIPDTTALHTWLNAPLNDTAYPGIPPELAEPFNVSGGLPTKVSLNTGNFRELWRAYWYVMADRPDQLADPTPFYSSGGNPAGQVAYLGMDFAEASGLPGNESNPWRMFRSSLRPGGGTGPMLSPPQQLLLRSAIAAANTMELRWGPMDAPGSNVPRRYLNSNNLALDNARVSDITVQVNNGGSQSTAIARVYGNKPQPFIAEVYANNDGAMHQKKQPDPNPDPNGPPPDPIPPFYRNPAGFVAITLHNPYTQSELSGPMDLGGWQLITVDRSTGKPTSPQVLYTFPMASANYKKTTIDPASAGTPGLLTLWTYDKQNPGDDTNKNQGKQFLPADITQDNSFPPPDPASVVQAPADVEKTHLIPNLSAAFGKELILVRPQVPGTNLAGMDPAAPGYWQQAVPVDSFDFTGMPAVSSQPTATFRAWVYRRNCDIKASGGSAYSEFRCVYPGRYDGRKGKLRQQGTFEHTFTLDPDTGDTVGQVFSGVKQPMFDNATGSYPATYNNNDPAMLFRIPIAAEDSPGPFGRGKTSGSNFFYPFGGFARNLDVMQVPFIGAYVIVDASGSLLEINPVTMDAAFAEDTDTGNDAREQVGRFVPIMATGAVVGIGDDWSSNRGDWRYRWTMKAVDFLCAELPAKDFLPAAGNEYAQRLYNNPQPMPVHNTLESRRHPPADGMLTNRDENAVGIEGLINLNTAPVPVLAALPFTKNRATNLQIAQAIAHYRDVDDGTGSPHGPFTNLFDLYRVPLFRQLSDTDLAANHRSTGYADGMLLPGPGSNSVYGIQNDFNERYLLLNRISNMVTLRSDTFTVYVMVQGWRNAGSDRPQLVAQRRAAFVVDRSGVSQQNRGAKITTLSVE